VHLELPLTPLQSNILVKSDHSAVLANFRSASFLPDSEVDVGVSIPECDLWSVRWLAPELLFPEKFGLESARRTKETDVYAFAMVMYEVGPLSMFQILLFFTATWDPRLRNSTLTTSGLLRIVPLRGSTERGFDASYKIGRSSTPAQERLRSRPHRRVMESDESMLETPSFSLEDFTHRFNSRAPLCGNRRRDGMMSVWSGLRSDEPFVFTRQ